MGKPKSLIGMVHVEALPGTPDFEGSMQAIIDAALRDAATLKEAGFDAILIENMHDLPYLNRDVGHEISSAMAVIGYLIKRAFQLPTGMQILAGANEAAIAAANSAGLDFIRAEGFVFSHVADEGLMNADAGKLMRFRKNIGAEQILVFSDLKKKHSAHAITADVDLLETAEAAAFFSSDGVIITGTSTGKSTSKADLEALSKQSLPVIVGSGITADNLLDYIPLADAFIVGSWLKKEGKWRNPVDYSRSAALSELFKSNSWKRVHIPFLPLKRHRYNFKQDIFAISPNSLGIFHVFPILYSTSLGIK